MDNDEKIPCDDIASAQTRVDDLQRQCAAAQEELDRIKQRAQADSGSSEGPSGEDSSKMVDEANAAYSTPIDVTPVTDEAAAADPVSSGDAATAQPGTAQTGQAPGAQSYYQAPSGAAQYCQQPYYTNQGYVATKDHVAAGLLAIFLGALGIHKFYLGYNTAGFIMLGVTILGSMVSFGLAALAMWVIGVVEGIIYLTKNQTEFDTLYTYNKREWF